MEREIVLLTIKLLQDQGLLGVQRNTMGANVGFSCPFPANHGGKTFQRTPSFNIHLDKGMWHCFGCKVGSKSIYDLYSMLAKVGAEDAKRIIGKPENQLQSLEAALNGLNDEGLEPFCRTAYPETVPLDQAPKALAYVEGRGIPRWVWSRAGLCYYDGQYMPKTVDNKGLVPGRRVILPIWWAGTRVGYSGRSLDKDVDMKYYRPVANMDQTVYNPFGITPADTDEVYVVEGEFDALASLREVMPTVGTWGSSISFAQAMFLSRFKRVRVMFDPDLAGRTGSSKAVEAYASMMDIMPVYLPDGMDPGSMPVGYGEAIRAAVAAADSRRRDLPFEELQRRLLDSVHV